MRIHVVHYFRRKGSHERVNILSVSPARQTTLGENTDNVENRNTSNNQDEFRIRAVANAASSTVVPKGRLVDHRLRSLEGEQLSEEVRATW